ncbi:hypothetical protein BGX38DRAFT_1272416 [Terfezia claveryi]|nr:hypothetical protein BGX38DRAFT_1272416 [Terfezia claveryi]
MAEQLSCSLSAPTNSTRIHLPTSRPVTLLSSSSSSSVVQTNPQKPLEAILNSPRFPDQHHEPVLRVLNATERIKRLLKVGSDGLVGGDVAGLANGKMELRVVWVQLEVIGDVIARFVTEVEASLANTRAFIKVTQKVCQGDKAQDLPLLFELLNLDDMIKGMYHLPLYSIDIHTGIISHLTSLKILLSRLLPLPVTAVTTRPTASSSIYSLSSNIQPAELLALLTQQINTLHRLIHSSKTLLSLNSSIKTQHTQICWRLQNRALCNISKQNKPTAEMLRTLAAALKVIRSVTFLPEGQGEAIVTVEEMRVSNDAFYRSLIPLIRQARTHMQLIDELGLHRNMDLNKDLVLPFYLEFVRYTRGTVDDSPLSKLGNEIGLGVGYGLKPEVLNCGDTPRCSISGGLAPRGAGSQMQRRLSLSVESVLGVGMGAFREGVKGWIKGHEGDELKRRASVGTKGILARWSGGGSQLPVVPAPPPIPKISSDLARITTADKHNTLKRKYKSSNLSDSFLALSFSLLSARRSKQHSDTDSLRMQLSNTTAATKNKYDGSRDGKGKYKREGVWISDDHKVAQDEWEEIALMVNVQKCMCRTGWMVGGMLHLRGRDGMGSGAMYGR